MHYMINNMNNLHDIKVIIVFYCFIFYRTGCSINIDINHAKPFVAGACLLPGGVVVNVEDALPAVLPAGLLQVQRQVGPRLGRPAQQKRAIEIFT